MGQIAKQSIKGTIVTYLGVAVGFVTTFFVLTRFLTSEEIGLARVLIDAATLFVGLAQLGTSSSIIRFFPYFCSSAGTNSSAANSRDAVPNGSNSVAYHGFFFWTLVVPLLGFGLFALVYLACHTPIAAFFGEKSPLFVSYYYLVLPMAFFLLYQTIFETNANVLMHIVVPRFVREVVVRVGLLVTYLLYAFHYLSMDGFVWALCATYALAALINALFLFSLFGRKNQVQHLNIEPVRDSASPCMGHGEWGRRLGDGGREEVAIFKLSNVFQPDFSFLRANRPLVRSYLLYTAFLIVSAVTSVLAPTLSSFFITAQMGLSYTGIFAIATYMAVMVSIPYRSVVAITQPELAMAIKNNDTPNISRLLRQAGSNLLLIGGFILLLIWLNIDLIFTILPNGSTYAVAKNVVLLLGIGQWMVASFNIFLPALSYSRYYAFSLVNSLVLTVSALFLNNYLIPIYGMLGAAWATVIADVAYYILVVVISTRATHSQPFSINHLWVFLLVLMVFALNYLWTTCLTPHCFVINATISLFVDNLSKSILLLGSALWVAYKMNLSPELNALLRKVHI